MATPWAGALLEKPPVTPPPPTLILSAAPPSIHLHLHLHLHRHIFWCLRLLLLLPPTSSLSLIPPHPPCISRGGGMTQQVEQPDGTTAVVLHDLPLHHFSKARRVRSECKPLLNMCCDRGLCHPHLPKDCGAMRPHPVPLHLASPYLASSFPVSWRPDTLPCAAISLYSSPPPHCPLHPLPCNLQGR